MLKVGNIIPLFLKKINNYSKEEKKSKKNGKPSPSVVNKEALV